VRLITRAPLTGSPPCPLTMVPEFQRWYAWQGGFRLPAHSTNFEELFGMPFRPKNIKNGDRFLSVTKYWQ